MVLTLYYAEMSHPSRSVLLVARALDIPLELKTIDFLSAEHFSENFLKMNPQHCIPLLADDEFYLSESAAIAMYLADMHGKDDTLYPKDPQKRAVINHRLFFNTGNLWIRVFQTYIYPVCFQNNPINDLIMDKLDDSFQILNTYLDGHDWIAGDEISIADYCLITSVSCAEVCGFDVSKYENVFSWLTRCKETMEDYEDLNQAGLDKFGVLFQDRLSKIESV